MAITKPISPASLPPASPPTLELGEDLVVSEDELDRIYGTDTAHTAPTSYMTALDFDADDTGISTGTGTIDDVPDWLIQASRGDGRTPGRTKNTTVWTTLVIVTLIVASGAGYQFQTELETAWSSTKTVAMQYLGREHAQ